MADSGVVRSRFRHRAWVAWLLAVLAGITALELGLRFGLGLGDPPRLQRDPNCEYRLVPSKSYRRFGHLIEVNEWSMRSGPLARHKQSASELRILVLGDSVINGGAPTDQNELATTLFEQRLGHALAPRVVRVANVSAGSWGPQNIAGYLREFGLFDADWVILVLSTHDLADVMSAEPAKLPAEFSGPLSGVTEALTTYAPRLLPGATAPAGPVAALDPKKVEVTTRALHELALLIDDAGIPAVALLHPERSELDLPLPGRAALRAGLEHAGFAVVDLIPAFRQALREGERPYRDGIHPSASGQKRLAQAFFDAVGPALGAGPTVP